MLQNNSHFATMQSNRSTTHNPLSKSFSAHWGSEMGFTKHALFLPSEPPSSFANRAVTPNNPHGDGFFLFFCGLCCFSSLSGDAEVQGWDVGHCWRGLELHGKVRGGVLSITYKDERMGKALEKLLHLQQAAKQCCNRQ